MDLARLADSPSSANARFKPQATSTARLAHAAGLRVLGATTVGLTDSPKRFTGASDLMVEVFADSGRHSRAAVGVAALPLNAAVEIDGIIEIG